MLTSFLETGTAIESRRVVCLIQARLYQMIVYRSLLSFAHHAVRLWRSPRRWPRGATNPVQIRWKSHVSFPLSWGRWLSLIRRNWLREKREVRDVEEEGAEGRGRAKRETCRPGRERLDSAIFSPIIHKSTTSMPELLYKGL